MRVKDERLYKAEKLYIEGDMGQKALAEAAGVSEGAIRRWSKQRGWVKKRQEFRDRALTKSLKKAETKRANELDKLRAGTDRLENSILAAAAALETALAQAAASGESADKVAYKMGVIANITSLSEALERATKVKMTLCRVMSIESENRFDIERKRLALQEAAQKREEKQEVSVELVSEVADYAE